MFLDQWWCGSWHIPCFFLSCFVENANDIWEKKWVKFLLSFSYAMFRESLIIGKCRESANKEEKFDYKLNPTWRNKWNFDDWWCITFHQHNFRRTKKVNVNTLATVSAQRPPHLIKIMVPTKAKLRGGTSQHSKLKCELMRVFHPICSLLCLKSFQLPFKRFFLRSFYYNVIFIQRK